MKHSKIPGGGIFAGGDLSKITNKEAKRVLDSAYRAAKTLAVRKIIKLDDLDDLVQIATVYNLKHLAKDGVLHIGARLQTSILWAMRGLYGCKQKTGGGARGMYDSTFCMDPHLVFALFEPKVSLEEESYD